MANTALKLYAGGPALASTVLFTSPAATKTVVKHVAIHNSTNADATISLSFGGIELIGDTIAAKNTVDFNWSLVLEAGTTITGFQSTASSINVYVSGVEIA